MYKTYKFSNQDPIIQEVYAAFLASGKSVSYIERKSGVNVNTIRSWFKGKTKRPQHASIRAVLRAIGYDLKVVKTAQIVRLETERKVA